MTHIWLRAETRDNEARAAMTPEGVAELLRAGYAVTVEASATRAFADDAYARAGASMANCGDWVRAPDDTIILGLKELPPGGTPLAHRHIMFGHAFKGQHSGAALLHRFQNGGGTLYDLEYLADREGRRVAAFGYWAGFAGAAVSLLAWSAQQHGEICAPLSRFADKDDMVDALGIALDETGRDLPEVLVIGALGRVGAGAGDLCDLLGVPVTRWDLAETASGGPFPAILEHEVFLNCILARPGTPVFVGPEALGPARRLSVIGDIACDPDSDYNPVPVYSEATTWDVPVTRVAQNPPLDVMAIDNLPSLLPRESAEDFAAQLLPHLLTLDEIDRGVWGRAKSVFDKAIADL